MDALLLPVKDREDTTVDEIAREVIERLTFEAAQHIKYLLRCGAMDTDTLTSADVRLVTIAALDDRVRREINRLSPAQKACLENLRKF